MSTQDDSGLTGRRWRRLGDRLFGKGPGRARLLGVVILAALAWLRIFDPSPLPEIRATFFDVGQSAVPREWDFKPVVIVDIDEASLKRFGQWPWPRTLLARLTNKIAEGEPLAVGLDLLFPEPDRLSPGRLANRLPGLDPNVKAALEALPSNDEIFGASLRRAPTVLGFAAVHASDTPPPIGGSASLAVGGDPVPHLIRYEGAIRTIDVIDAGARGRGTLTVAPEHDGVVRRVPLVLRVGDATVPSLTLEMLRVAFNAPAHRIHVDPGGIAGVSVADVFIPTRRDGRVWVHYTPHQPERFVSAADLLDGKIHPSVLNQRFVLLGTTGLGLTDFPATPVAANMPGVEIHAQLLETMLAGQTLQRPRYMIWIEVALLVLGGLTLVLLVPSVQPRNSVLPLVAIVLLLLAASWVGYTGYRVLLDASYPVAANVAVYAAMVAATLVSVDQHRRQLARDLQYQREQAARLEGELGAARSIQMGILPRDFPAYPDRHEFDLYAMIEPARAVGGDLYDFALIGDDQLYFMIGDVSGKGVPAALFMALTKALYRSSAMRRRIPIEEIMTEANAEVSRENPAMMFVTIAAGILDIRTGELKLCSAGHDSPFLLREGQPAELMTLTGGPPLCAIDDFEFPADTFQLRPGDALLLFTDGVTEAMNPEQELYGAERAKAALERAGHAADMRTLTETLTADITIFISEAEPSDDITILALRWNGPQPLQPV